MTEPKHLDKYEHADLVQRLVDAIEFGIVNARIELPILLHDALTEIRRLRSAPLPESGTRQYGDAFEFWWSGTTGPGFPAQFKEVAWEAWKASARRPDETVSATTERPKWFHESPLWAQHIVELLDWAIPQVTFEAAQQLRALKAKSAPLSTSGTIPPELAQRIREIVNYEGWQGEIFRELQKALGAGSATQELPNGYPKSY